MTTRKNKILVVDDSESNLSLLEEVLLEYDYSVITAHGGKEALSQIINEIPDLILLDIMMPDYSGYEVLEHLSAKNNQIPIIVISARTGSDDVQKAYSLGAKYFIHKPVIITHVLEKIDEVLQKSQN